MRGNGDVSKEKLGKRGQKDGLVVFLAKYLHFLFGLRESKGVSVDPRRLPEDLSGFMIGRPEDEQESLLEGYPMLQPLFPGLDKIGIAHSITGLSARSRKNNFPLFPAQAGMTSKTSKRVFEQPASLSVSIPCESIYDPPGCLAAIFPAAPDASPGADSATAPAAPSFARAEGSCTIG